MHLITGYILLYYTFKLLFLDTKLPTGESKPTFFKADSDKLVVMAFIFIWFMSRNVFTAHKWVNYVKIACVSLGSLFILYFTIFQDFFFVKDKQYILNFFKRNSGNMIYLLLFIACIILFTIFQ